MNQFLNNPMALAGLAVMQGGNVADSLVNAQKQTYALQEQQRAQQAREALANIDLSDPASIQAVMKIDPDLGVKLMQQQRLKAQQEQEAALLSGSMTGGGDTNLSQAYMMAESDNPLVSGQGKALIAQYERENPQAPSGYRSVDGGIEPIPGSAQAREAEAASITRKKGENVTKTALRLVDELLDPKLRSGVESVVGVLDSKTPTIFGDSANAQRKINQLKNILTAENLDIMTGVLSESDIKIIQGIAGGGLDESLATDEAFLDELGKLKKSLGKKLEPDNLQEGDYINLPPAKKTIKWGDLK